MKDRKNSGSVRKKSNRFPKPVLFAISAGLILFLFFSPTGKALFNSVKSTVSSGVLDTMATVNRPISSVTDKAGDGLDTLLSFGKTRQENLRLEKENQELRRQLVENVLKAEELQEFSSLVETLQYVESDQPLHYVSADIIAFDNSQWFSSFTVGVGSNQNVRKNDIVINGDGLVGKVSSVGNTSSKVVSIFDESLSIGYRIQRDPATVGILEGGGDGTLIGSIFVSQTDSNANRTVVQGDVLITSGIGLYPKGIVIGIVEDIIDDTGDGYGSFVVKPAAVPGFFSKVTVIGPDDSGESER